MRAFFYTLSLMLACSTAYAQNQPPASQGAPKVPTTFAALEVSMTSLLNEHWAVISGGLTMAGPMFTLQKDGKYILCGVDDGRSMFAGGKAGPTSQCWALN